MGKMFGGKDINFPESPAPFSEKYILRAGTTGRDPRFFNPAVRSSNAASAFDPSKAAAIIFAQLFAPAFFI